MMGQNIRHNHDGEEKKIGDYPISSRTIFFFMIFSDMIEKSSFQQIDCDTKNDSHEETTDTKCNIIIIFIDDVWEIDGAQS